MGNSSSHSSSQILSETSWNLSQLPDVKKSLGSRSEHIYSSFPKSIPQEKVVSNMDLRNFSCQDGNKLNDFLESVLQHIQGAFVKDNWTEDAFPSHLENLTLLDKELLPVTLTEEELQVIREQFKLPEKVTEKRKVESEKEGKTETVEEDVEVDRDIEQVYQGYSIYEFPEGGLGMPLELKTVGLESCFVGCMEDELVVMAPSEEPVLSRSIRFDWQVVQVGKDSIRLILNKARGVVFEDGKELEEVNENYFENLEKAHTAYEKNSSREMTLYSNKYLSWVKQVRDEGELQALAGGEIDGEMVSLVEFLDRMQL
jgi:hypothetical protein